MEPITTKAGTQNHDGSNQVRVSRWTKAEDLPALLTVAELGAFLSLGRSSAYALVEGGRMRHIRLGRCLRIPKSAVLELLGKEETDGR